MDESKIDISKFQVVEGSMFSPRKDAAVTIRSDGIVFNSACIHGLEEISGWEKIIYIQILMDTKGKRMVVRGCQEDDPGALRWCNERGEKRKPRKIAGKAFVSMVYEMMQWDIRYRYVLYAKEMQIGRESVYCFYLEKGEKKIDYKIQRIIDLFCGLGKNSGSETFAKEPADEGKSPLNGEISTGDKQAGDPDERADNNNFQKEAGDVESREFTLREKVFRFGDTIDTLIKGSSGIPLCFRGILLQE